jgi:hypothetical protein
MLSLQGLLAQPSAKRQILRGIVWRNDAVSDKKVDGDKIAIEFEFIRVADLLGKVLHRPQME